MAWTQVETGMIKDAAVTAAKLASGAALSNLGSSSITATQLAGNAVGYSQLLSTDWTNSKSTSGYQKLPSGLIIQWGQATSNTSNVVVSFPIAFPTACASVVASANDTPAVGVFVALAGISASSFNSAVNTGGARVIWWVAIGY
jgi:hypothetical protein